MFRRGKHIGLLLMLLCCANLRSQVVVTLPFYENFESYIEDSIRHIDATHTYTPAYHFFGGWEGCSRGWAGTMFCRPHFLLVPYNNYSYINNGTVRMDYAGAWNDYHPAPGFWDTTYDYKCGGSLLASPWFYELPARVTFDFVVAIDTNSPNPGAELIPLEIEVGILTDSVPDTTTTNWWTENRTGWPCNPTCGRDFIPFSTQTYTLNGYEWKQLDVNVLGMFDGVTPPYRIGFRTKRCDTLFIGFPAANSTFLDNVRIYPAHITTSDTLLHTDTVCLGTPYSGYGFTPSVSQTSTPGTYTFDYTELVNDSTTEVHLLTLTILPTSDTVLYDTIFIGDSLSFFDTTLTQNGVYLYTAVAANGCDSTVTLHLQTVIRKDTITVRDTICLGELYNGYGFYAKPTMLGTFTFQRDSVDDFAQRHYVLKLFVSSTDSTVLHVSIDAGDTLRYGGTAIADSGEYIFHFTNQYGCDSMVTLIVGLNAVPPPPPEEPPMYNIWFPNAFTPDQETNNRFRGHLSFEPVKYQLYIYNRWGNLIFSTTDPSAAWDGTAKGIPQPQAAYVYKYEVELPNGIVRAGIGTVTMIR